MRRSLVLALAAAAAVAIGCAKKEEPPPPAPAPVAVQPAAPAPLAVGAITLGNAIGSDKKVASPLESFGVKDKIYASVETTGAGHAKLRALWSYLKGGKTAKVDETSMEFDAAGPAWNEFHIQNTKDWPKGDYQVEIFLGDGTAPASSKSFKIQ